MPLPRLDPFERFAERCGLHLCSESLPVAPRDVAAPIEEAEQHFLVTLSGTSAEAGTVRLVFVAPVTSSVMPGFRDVLWWLAGDAWALERSERTLERWAGVHGLPPTDAGTRRLFECHLRQRDSLVTLLGQENYQQLLGLYAEEVSAPRAQ